MCAKCIGTPNKLYEYFCNLFFSLSLSLSVPNECAADTDPILRHRPKVIRSPTFYEIRYKIRLPCHTLQFPLMVPQCSLHRLIQVAVKTPDLFLYIFTVSNPEEGVRGGAVG